MKKVCKLLSFSTFVSNLYKLVRQYTFYFNHYSFCRNCKIHTAVFVVYLSEGHTIPQSSIDCDLMRSRCAILLWDYDKRKNDESAVSDDEAPMRPPRDPNDSSFGDAILI